nr:MAG TPA_asm: hypothetical protein [Caudoviricetes sp.]
MLQVRQVQDIGRVLLLQERREGRPVQGLPPGARGQRQPRHVPVDP